MTQFRPHPDAIYRVIHGVRPDFLLPNGKWISRVIVCHHSDDDHGHSVFTAYANDGQFLAEFRQREIADTWCDMIDIALCADIRDYDPDAHHYDSTI